MASPSSANAGLGEGGGWRVPTLARFTTSLRKQMACQHSLGPVHTLGRAQELRAQLQGADGPSVAHRQLCLPQHPPLSLPPGPWTWGPVHPLWSDCHGQWCPDCLTSQCGSRAHGWLPTPGFWPGLSPAHLLRAVKLISPTSWTTMAWLVSPSPLLVRAQLVIPDKCWEVDRWAQGHHPHRIAPRVTNLPRASRFSQGTYDGSNSDPIISASKSEIQT